MPSNDRVRVQNMRDRTEARGLLAASLSERKRTPTLPDKEQTCPIMPARPALMGPPETPATAAALALPETDTEEPLALM